MDIQPVFNRYKAVTYFSETEDQCSQTIKQASKEAFERNMNHHDTMKTIVRAYLSNCECSILKAVYHILRELKLRRIFLAVYFVNTNLPEDRIQVLLPEKELSELPDNTLNIFKRSNTVCYMARLSSAFCHGEYSVLNHFFE